MRTSTLIMGNPFIVDPLSVTRDGGRVVNWDLVPENYRATVVTVTLGAQTNANATSSTVVALTKAIPAGAVVYFGAVGSKQFLKLTAPAAVGATTLTHEAAPTQINNATVGYWGGNGAKTIPAGTVMAEVASTGKVVPRASVATMATYAATSAARAEGNTGNGAMGAITTSNGVKPGVYRLRINRAVANAGDFFVEDPTGILVGYGTVAVAFSNGGLAFTLADGATDFVLGDGFDITVAATTLYSTIGLIETAAAEWTPGASDGYNAYSIIVGGVINENMLPEATGTPKVISSAYKTELQTAGVGTGWSWQQYGDNRS